MDDIAPPRIPILMPKARGKEPLTIYQLSITMILFVAGIVLSLVIFILELFNKNGWRKANKSSDEVMEVTESQSMMATPPSGFAHPIGSEKEGKQVFRRLHTRAILRHAT